MAGESTGMSIQDMIMRGVIGGSSGSGDGGGSGGGGICGVIPNANICWWSIQSTGPMGIFEIQFSVLAGCGNPRKFGSKFMEAISGMGKGFLDALSKCEGVQAVSVSSFSGGVPSSGGSSSVSIG